MLEEGETSQAVDHLTRLQVERPEDPEVTWSLGEALFSAGRYDDAARVFRDLADRAPDAEHSMGARYNSGLSHYGAGRLDEAVEAWDQVLEQDPDNEMARQNADAVRQELAQRIQEPPPQDSEGEDGDPSEGDTGQGEPQDGEPGDTGGSPENPPPEESPGEEQDPGDGVRPEQADAGEAGDEAEGEVKPLAGAEDTATPEAEAELPQGVQELSEEEAQRLLEAVEEGNPRVTVRGRSDGKDW